MYGLIVR